MERRRFRVRIDSSVEVLAYGYEFHQPIGRLKELPQGGWQAATTTRRPVLDSPALQRGEAIDVLVRLVGLRGAYDID